jgi:hypothetical protein
MKATKHVRIVRGKTVPIGCRCRRQTAEIRTRASVATTRGDRMVLGMAAGVFMYLWLLDGGKVAPTVRLDWKSEI